MIIVLFKSLGELIRYRSRYYSTSVDKISGMQHSKIIILLRFIAFFIHRRSLANNIQYSEKS
ncbi:hypothetical protein BpHYR1_054526 [Brachionus plicatilis]|uniref:Uncharacterized protein n=1 Tax=Brachionus plicatilis TaxID=10195 RepID=A0A3M7S2E5_BRAPC|nr:hypothetical protein BpHYR1_054526 [Brachionus plicatilis]